MEDNLQVECLEATDLHLEKINNTTPLTTTNGHEKNSFDLNQQLILNKAASFFVKMNGDAMAHAGIQHNDLLVVDRSIKPAEGKFIIAKVQGKMVVCRYQHIGHSGKIASGETWGVITCIIHITDASLFANLFKTNQVR